MLQNNKDLIRIIDRLIQDDGYRDYSKITSADKESVVAFCMSALADTSEIDYFFGDEVRSVATDLIKYMTTNEACRAMDLAENLKKSAIKYFDNILIEIFHDRLEYLDIIDNHESGLSPVIDSITGETSWMK